MNLLTKLAGLTLLLLAIVPVVTLTLIIENEPLLRDRPDITPEQIARAKMIFERNDPRRLRSGSIARATVEQKDMDLALNYFISHTLGGASRLKIDNGRALIESTLKLPTNPLGRYVNLKLVLRQTDRLPEVDQLTLGKLPIPGPIANFLLTKMHTRVLPETDWQLLQNMIRTVKFRQSHMTVTYKWHHDLTGKLSGVFISAPEQQRIEIYQQRLTELARTAKNDLELTTLTRPLFRLAKERSRQGDAVEENRAVILVLTLYVNRLTLNKWIPTIKTQYRPIWRTVISNNRSDLTKHYLVSAMLAAYAGTPLADAVGLYKEIEDSRGGSGFSFNDLAADRAGAQMGERAVRNEAQAKAIQRLMATADERDFMPKTDDLPEFITEAEFERRYGGLEGKTYLTMLDEIERRIAALPVSRL